MVDERKIEEYMKRPYEITLIPNDDGSYFAEIKALPGCMSQGDTVDDAIAMIKDAMRGWIKTALELGREIPLPLEDREYSGKFVLRVPASLHRELATLAEREGVSLNQMAVTLLAKNITVFSVERHIRRLAEVMTEHAVVISSGQLPAAKIEGTNRIAGTSNSSIKYGEVISINRNKAS